MQADAQNSNSVEIGLAARVLHKTSNTDIKLIKNQLEAAKDMNVKARELFETLPKEANVSEDMVAYSDLVVCRVFLADLIESNVALPVVPPDGLTTVQMLPAASSGGRRMTPCRTLSGSGSRTSVPMTPPFALPGG